MTNINKPEREISAKEEPVFDGITFEVEEEEHTHEGQKVKRRGIYLWPNLITTAALPLRRCLTAWMAGWPARSARKARSANSLTLCLTCWPLAWPRPS